jgi:hypothetical protein
MLGDCVSDSSLEQHFALLPPSHVHKFAFGLVIRHLQYGYVARTDGRDIELEHPDTVSSVPRGYCCGKFMNLRPCANASPPTRPDSSADVRAYCDETFSERRSDQLLAEIADGRPSRAFHTVPRIFGTSLVLDRKNHGRSRHMLKATGRPETICAVGRLLVSKTWMAWAPDRAEEVEADPGPI